MKNESISTKYLDGLRTIGCLMVLIYHLSFFLPGTGIGKLTRGGYAVTYFLILSGMVMVLSFHKRNIKPSVPSTLRFIAHRYLRLLPTVAISVMAAYAIIYLGWTAYIDQVYAIKSMDFLLTAFPVENVSWLNAVYEAFVGTFIHTTPYVAPLWTIPYEFLGICCVYIVYCFLYNKKWRIFPFCALFALTFIYRIHLSKIVLGVMIGDILFNPNVGAIKLEFEWLKIRTIQITMLVLGIVFSAFVLLVRQSPIVEMVGITFIVLAFLFAQNKLKGLLESSLILWMSKYSFMVYAIHWVLIFSFGCWVLAKFYKMSGNYYIAAVGMLIVTLVVTWMIAVVLQELLNWLRKVRR